MSARFVRVVRQDGAAAVQMLATAWLSVNSPNTFCSDLSKHGTRDSCTSLQGPPRAPLSQQAGCFLRVRPAALRLRLRHDVPTRASLKPYSLNRTMSASDSYIISDMTSSSPEHDDDDLDSLPSISSGVLSSESDMDAQREWEESLEQIQLLLTMVVVPFAGKYLGRQFAYWSAYFRPPLFFPPEMRHTGLTLDPQQAGHVIWNGCTTWRSGGRTRRHSRQLGRSRQLCKWKEEKKSIIT